MAIKTGNSTHYTAEEVASRCHISIGTLHRWYKAGKIPAPVRLGRRLLFPAEAIDNHLATLEEVKP